MAEEGAKVAVFDRGDAAGHALPADVTYKGQDVAFWVVDVTNEAARKAAIDVAAKRFGGLHVIIENAGM